MGAVLRRSRGSRMIMNHTSEVKAVVEPGLREIGAAQLVGSHIFCKRLFLGLQNS